MFVNPEVPPKTPANSSAVCVSSPHPKHPLHLWWEEGSSFWPGTTLPPVKDLQPDLAAAPPAPRSTAGTAAALRGLFASSSRLCFRQHPTVVGDFLPLEMHLFSGLI